MFIPDFMIRDWARNGGVNPFDPTLINPASVDLRWSGRINVPNTETRKFERIAAEEYTMQPGGFYLLDTLEYVKVPHDWAGILMLKSSIARLGIEHLHAGFFDPGFEGTATLELKIEVPWPVTIKKNQKIVQLAFIHMFGVPLNTYEKVGHYVGQVGPTEANTEHLNQ